MKNLTRNMPSSILGITIYFLFSATVTFATTDNAKKKPAQKIERYSASAYDMKTGKYLYTAYHVVTLENGREIRRKIYYRKGKEKIADKRISYRKNATVPDFEAKHHRIDYEEGASVSGNYVNVFVKTNRDRNRRQNLVKIKENSILDTGFDAFVHKNWNSLMNGKQIKVNFIIPARLTSYTFRVQKSREYEYKGRRLAEFKVKIANFFIRMIVRSIYVSYDIENRRLMVYRGLSNIRDRKGKNLKTNIYFHYGELVGSK